jgi:hypothetical protein
MSSYTHKVSVQLSDANKEKLEKFANNSAKTVTISISPDSLNGDEELLLTKAQFNAFNKKVKAGHDASVRLSREQVENQTGSGWISSLLKLALPMIKKEMPKVLGTLALSGASGALSGASGALSGATSKWTSGSGIVTNKEGAVRQVGARSYYYPQKVEYITSSQMAKIKKASKDGLPSISLKLKRAKEDGQSSMIPMTKRQATKLNKNQSGGAIFSIVLPLLMSLLGGLGKGVSLDETVESKKKLLSL